MIKSMTGFGRGRFEKDGMEFTIDIKSVNHKYHDITVKMPRSINYLEEYVKKRINEVISRGKIDVFISYMNFSNDDKEIKINEKLASSYLTSVKNISTSLNLEQNISIIDILNFPDVVTIVDNKDEEKIKQQLDIALNEAISNFLKMRQAEGEQISKDLEQRLNFIHNTVEKISVVSTGLVEQYVVKLKERIKELLKDNIIDENRLAMETVIYADKCSIEEEITRLKSHINQFKYNLLEDKPTGKKLDFLVQEMNREINTIASKANCLQITQEVIELKNELENIREQIQNIE